MSKVLKYVLPVAAMAVPFAFPATMAAVGGLMGGGQLLGSGLTSALLSGVGSAAQGKSVGNSLLSAGLGGVGGALAGGGASALTNAAGLTGTAAKAAQGALTGAAYGGASGGGSGALTGALMGGIGGGAMDALGGASGTASGLGDAPMTTMSSSGNPMSTTANMAGLTTGTGLASGGGQSAMNLGDALKLGSSVYSGLSTQATNEEMQKKIEDMARQASGVLSPYTSAGGAAVGQLGDALTRGFNYEDYANTPAYQFQLGEGQKAIQQQLAAQGLGQSGAAVKAATEYGTNLANQNYGDAYNQWLQRNQQLAGLSGVGLNAADNTAGLLSGAGMTNAMLTGANQNAMNEMLSGISTNPLTLALLRGSGMFA